MFYRALTGDYMVMSLPSFEHITFVTRWKNWYNSLTQSYFAQNVPIPPDNPLYLQNDLERCHQAFQKAITTYQIKTMRPLKRLCQRLFDNNKGLTILHYLLITQCAKYNLFQQISPIIEYPALPLLLPKSLHNNYYQVCCKIYIALRMYNKAHEFVNLMGENKEDILKLKIVLGMVVGKPYSKEKFKLELEKIKMSSKLMPDFDRLQGFEQEYAKNFQLKVKEQQKRRQFVLTTYLSLDSSSELGQDEKRLLQNDQLYTLYLESRHTSFRKYLIEDIVKKNWRLKATEINGKDIRNFDIIKMVNHQSSVYRYDCKNKIVYFNHVIGDQDKLNLLITKSAIMQKEINNCQINLREKRLHGHGRMGGMMGMMGRMGGMGGMGSMGGMGRLGGGMGRMGMGF